MDERKELQRMFRNAKRGEFQKIYVKDISRLFRNMLDFVTFSREIVDKHGIQIHLCNMGDGKDMDSFLLGIFAMFAEYESQKISERVRFGKNISKEKGIVPNFVFGYDRPDKWTLIPNAEAVWVKKIFDMYTEQGIGMSRIAEYLFEKRVETKKKKKDGTPNVNWSQNTVKRILRNRKYIGIIENNKQTRKNLYSKERVDIPEDKWMITIRPEIRIISDAQFAKAQKLMETNKKTFPTDPKTGKRTLTRRSEAHVLSNLLKCPTCESSFRRYKRTSYSVSM
jgi:DNA invertase Pin-like site-specific DNA recombinase